MSKSKVSYGGHTLTAESIRMFLSQNTIRRTCDDAFPDDDDEWVFDLALDWVMVSRGAAAGPLLEFEPYPVRARRNWKKCFEQATDNLGQEPTNALRQSIDQQIAADPIPQCTSPCNPVPSLTSSNLARSPYANWKKAVKDRTLTLREIIRIRCLMQVLYSQYTKPCTEYIRR